MTGDINIDAWLEGNDHETILMHALRLHLRKANNNTKTVAASFGVSRATVYRYMERLNKPVAEPLPLLTTIQQGWVQVHHRLKSFMPHEIYTDDEKQIVSFVWPGITLLIFEKDGCLWMEWNQGVKWRGPVSDGRILEFLDDLKKSDGPLIFESLPWPPSINHYYMQVGKRKILTDKARAFREDMKVAIQAQMLERYSQLIPEMPLKQTLAVKIDLHPPDKRTRDVDNYYKGVFDAFTHAGLWQDDKLVRTTTVTMKDNIKGGAIMVTIAKYEEDSDVPT